MERGIQMPILSVPESTLHYTAIGDSLTVGKMSGLFAPGFAERFALKLRTFEHCCIIPSKFAKNGATSGEIFQMAQLPPIAQALGQSSIVTITSGGNDLIDGGLSFLRTHQIQTIETAIETALANNCRILNCVAHLQQINNVNGNILLLNMYNPFQSIEEADRGIQSYNHRLQQLGGIPGVKIVDIYHVFKGHLPYLLSSDGIHPNSEGYEVIANTLMNYA